MATLADEGLYYDHFSVKPDPHPVFRRLRAQDPLHYHEEHGYWIMTRYADIAQALTDTTTYSSARGVTLEFILENTQIPPGMLIFEDPPTHTMRRHVLMRMFKPKRIAALEEQIRDFCVRTLDPLLERGHFDVITELSHVVPMRVIGMLMGMPEEDQEAIRDKFAQNVTHAGAESDGYGVSMFDTSILGDYLDWRLKNQSDDLVTAMMTTPFKDEHGETRTLTRDEMHLLANLLVSAGNETTGRLIGWLAKLMADYPDQRREVAQNPKLALGAVDEIMRFEPPALQICRYVTRDVEMYGKVMPAGSAVLLATASANRDETVYADPDRFDIHRREAQNMTLGYGPHFCLGAALTKLEGKVVLEEMLKRMPDWTVDKDNAEATTATAFHGWEKMPIFCNA